MHSLQAPAFSSAGSVVVQVQSSVEMFEPCPPSPMTMQGGTRIRRHCCHSQPICACDVHHQADLQAVDAITAY